MKRAMGGKAIVLQLASFAKSANYLNRVICNDSLGSSSYVLSSCVLTLIKD